MKQFFCSITKLEKYIIFFWCTDISTKFNKLSQAAYKISIIYQKYLKRKHYLKIHFFFTETEVLKIVLLIPYTNFISMPENKKIKFQMKCSWKFVKIQHCQINSILSSTSMKLFSNFHQSWVNPKMNRTKNTHFLCSRIFLQSVNLSNNSKATTKHIQRNQLKTFSQIFTWSYKNLLNSIFL